MSFLLEFFKSFSPSMPGFMFMWILIGILVLAVVLVLERFFFLNKTTDINSNKFVLKLRHLIGENKLEDAVSLCESAGKRALPWVLKGAFIRAVDKTPELVKTEVEQNTVSVIPRLERRLNYIATLGNISTLIGLMGTIYGLILAFAAVSVEGVAPELKTSMLATGISAAMNTTLMGLIISIPCIVAYTNFRERIDTVIGEIDKFGRMIINLLCPEGHVAQNYNVSGKRAEAEVDTEADMTPIMGLMVCLIPLLLSSAEFVKIGSVELKLPPAAGGGGAGKQNEQPKEKPKTLDLLLIITEKGINISTSAKPLEAPEEGEEQTYLIPAKKRKSKKGVSDQFDFKKLNKELTKVKKKVFKDILSSFKGSKKKASFYSIWKSYAILSKQKEFEEYIHYKDFESIKLVASKKIPYQTIIQIMDAARLSYAKKPDGKVKKVLMFPSVSLGVAR